ncbi:MAG: hypothetical protein LBM02_09915 [Lachnospiraceae bacterium]|jgi:hypothetical protein|nr:hypothetical protein [Lachnospiraceae bacterium]
MDDFLKEWSDKTFSEFEEDIKKIYDNFDFYTKHRKYKHGHITDSLVEFNIDNIHLLNYNDRMQLTDLYLDEIKEQIEK